MIVESNPSALTFMTKAKIRKVRKGIRVNQINSKTKDELIRLVESGMSLKEAKGELGINMDDVYVGFPSKKHFQLDNQHNSPLSLTGSKLRMLHAQKLKEKRVDEMKRARNLLKKVCVDDNKIFKDDLFDK